MFSLQFKHTYSRRSMSSCFSSGSWPCPGWLWDSGGHQLPIFGPGNVCSLTGMEWHSSGCKRQIHQQASWSALWRLSSSVSLQNMCDIMILAAWQSCSCGDVQVVLGKLYFGVEKCNIYLFWMLHMKLSDSPWGDHLWQQMHLQENKVYNFWHHTVKTGVLVALFPSIPFWYLYDSN